MASNAPGPAPMSAPLVNETTFIGVVWAGTAIGTIALAFRYYVRYKCFHRLLPDDFITGFAWILLLATAILWQIIVHDMYEAMVVFVDHDERFVRGILAVYFMFFVGLWTIKMNFLVFFYRLGNQITYYRIVWWTVTVITVSAGLACIGTIQYHCFADDIELIMVNCVKPDAVEFNDIHLKLSCALDVITDALIMALPISVLWNVRMSIRRRLALGGIFSLVILTMTVSIVRVAVIFNAAAYSQHNKQLEGPWLYMWSFIELSVALLVACLASFRSLFINKARSRASDEALARGQANKASSGPSLKATKARAKLFQESLFDTIKTVDNDRAVSIAERPLHNVRSDSHDTLQVDRFEMEELPELNMHVSDSSGDNVRCVNGSPSREV